MIFILERNDFGLKNIYECLKALNKLRESGGSKKNDNYQGSANGLKLDLSVLLLVLTLRLGPYLTILRWIKTYPIIDWTTNFIHFIAIQRERVKEPNVSLKRRYLSCTNMANHIGPLKKICPGEVFPPPSFSSLSPSLAH